MRKFYLAAATILSLSIYAMSGGVYVGPDGGGYYNSGDGYYYDGYYYPYYYNDYWNGPGWYYGFYFDSEPAYWGWRRSNPHWWHHHHRWGGGGQWHRGHYHHR